MQTFHLQRTRTDAGIPRQKSMAARWLLLICMSCLCSSCASWEEYKVDSAEMSEFQGNHYVFWPYANMGFAAAAKRDWPATQHWYLRAYRNTGMDLLPSGYLSMNETGPGSVADRINFEKSRDYASELDGLTPIPGTGESANDVLDTAMNYQRSLAAYDWARATGRMGEYENAERAFLYSLHLEQTRDLGSKNKLIASRYYELARLYHAWGKRSEAIQYYREALTATDQGTIQSDPIGFAEVLDEFASYLNEAGQTNEASGFRQQSAELRRNNPGKKAKFGPDPYPASKP